MEETVEIGANLQIAVGGINKAHHLNGLITEVNLKAFSFERFMK